MIQNTGKTSLSITKLIKYNYLSHMAITKSLTKKDLLNQATKHNHNIMKKYRAFNDLIIIWTWIIVII